MGFFSKLTDDILGLDPGGGGIYNVARDVLGDKIADDVLGMDPGGGGAVKFYNAAAPLVAGYYGYQALGGADGIANMFGSGSGAAGMGGAQGLSAGGGAGLAGMGGAQGLGSCIGTGLAGMGGAQGLGAGAASGIGAGIGAAGAGAGAAGGLMSTLGKYATPLALGGNALLGAYSANKAAGVQSDAARYAADLQREQFERQVELQTPFRDVGVRALPELEAASRYTPFGMAQFQADPGYAFRLSEGQKQLDRMAAIRGGQISGSSLKAAARYGQDMGSQEYTNAFNRYQTERGARLNPLQSLAGFGQTSTNQLGAAGQSMASGVGEALGAGAQARASGYMGAANAVAGGLGQYINYGQQQQQNSLLQQALSRPTGYGLAADSAPNLGYQDPYAGLRYGSST